MINIVYDRNNHKLTVEGHAYSGEAGHDLVCSASSILAYTLASNVEYISECGQARNPITILNSGNATIGCTPEEGFTSVVVLIYETICAGYALLAHDYPEYVSFKVIDSI